MHSRSGHALVSTSFLVLCACAQQPKPSTMTLSYPVTTAAEPQPFAAIISQGVITWPRFALDNGVEGTLIAHVLVSETGSPLDVKIVSRKINKQFVQDINSGNYIDVTTIFDQVSLDSLRVGRYKPALVSGIPARVWSPVEMRFLLPTPSNNLSGLANVPPASPPMPISPVSIAGAKSVGVAVNLSVTQRLQQLRSLYDAKLINEADYEEKKAVILKSM